MLNALCRNTQYQIATVWVQLHTNDPGFSTPQSTNIAGETDRSQATFGSVASGGAISNTVAIAWTAVSTSETYVWVSLWSLSSGGTHLGNAQLTQSKVVNSGDDFSIPVGDLDVTIT